MKPLSRQNGHAPILRALALAFALTASSCGERPAPNRVDDLLHLVPGGAVQWAVVTDDAEALRAAVTTSPRFQALLETDFWHDVTLLPSIVAFRQAAAEVSHAGGVDARQVLAQAMLRGPLLVAVQEPKAPRGDRSFLLVKRLDMSQQTVAAAVQLWLEAGDEVKVSDDPPLSYRRLSRGHTGLYYFRAKDLAVLSDSEDLIASSARLAAGNARDLTPLDRRTYLPTPGKGVTVMADLDAFVAQKPGWSLVTRFLGLRATGVTIPLEGTPIAWTWAADTSSTAPMRGLDYVPRDAPICATVAQVHPTDALTRLRTRWDRAVRDTLPRDALRTVSKALEGPAFYALLGLSADPASPGVSQVLGFQVKPGVDLETPLLALWRATFEGPVAETVLERLGAARLVCAGDDPFCFALHKDMLLVGPEPALRRSLAVATGTEPGILDRLHTGDTQGLEPASAGLVVDFRRLGRSLVAHLESLADDDMPAEQVRDVLGPFFDAIGGFEAYAGFARPSADGKAVGRLVHLESTP